MSAPPSPTNPPNEAARLRRALIATAVLAAIALGIVLGLPGLSRIVDRLGDAAPGWVVVAVVLQLLSCWSYVVFFELCFDRGPRSFTSRVAWAELAANAVLPAGGAGGLGLGAWLLRQRGASGSRIATQSVVIFVATSAVTAAALIVTGLGLAIGLFAGPHDLLLGALPAGIGVAGVALTWLLAIVAERAAARRRGRVAAALEAIAHGIRGTAALLHRRDWRVLGAVGYWAFNTAVLWACFKALGETPPMAVIVMGHLIGQLGGELPIPGGVGAVDGGLIGSLVLYGTAPVPAAAAVLLFRAISLWIPAVLGTIAFVSARREIRRAGRAA